MTIGQRVKGQETEIVIVTDGQPRLNIANIKSHSITWKFDKLEEGYLGETSDRYDMLFKGIDGKLTIHTNDPDIFTFIEQVKAKAQSRVPGTRFSIRTVINYPSTGRRVRILVQDVSFGDIPLDIAGRGEYVKFDLDYSASDGKGQIS